MSLTQIKDWDGIRSYFSKQCNRSENRMRDALMSLDVKERAVISVATKYAYSDDIWPDVIAIVLNRCKNGQGADALDAPLDATTSGVFRIVHNDLGPDDFILEEKYELAFPAMDDATRAAMKESIKNNGFMNPVTIKLDGTLVDGYHRHKIWIELLSEGLPALKLPYRIRKFKDEDEVTQFLEDMNKHRRHLDIFSAVKAALEELPKAEEEARTKRYEAHSATLRGDKPAGDDIQGRTLEQVAKRHGASESRTFRGRDRASRS